MWFWKWNYCSTTIIFGTHLVTPSYHLFYAWPRFGSQVLWSEVWQNVTGAVYFRWHVQRFRSLINIESVVLNITDIILHIWITSFILHKHLQKFNMIDCEDNFVNDDGDGGDDNGDDDDDDYGSGSGGGDDDDNDDHNHCHHYHHLLNHSAWYFIDIGRYCTYERLTKKLHHNVCMKEKKLCVRLEWLGIAFVGNVSTKYLSIVIFHSIELTEQLTGNKFAKKLDRHTEGKWLTHWGLVTPFGDIDLGQNWFKLWLVAWRHQAITWTNVDLSSATIH